MEQKPIYVLKAGRDLSPVFESPLELFDPERMGPVLERDYGIPTRCLTGIAGVSALKQFRVVLPHPVQPIRSPPSRRGNAAQHGDRPAPGTCRLRDINSSDINSSLVRVVRAIRTSAVIGLMLDERGR